MTASRVIPLALLLSAVLAAAPAPAGAVFGPPAELARGPFGTTVVAATDAAGATTAVLIAGGAPQLVQRPGSAAPWGAPQPLPGRGLGHASGPVVAAAGQGAAAIAWRIDTPKKYMSIAAMVRDPGGAFDAPVVVSPADAGGVRHPAVAIDAGGRALLAYNTNTRAVHLSLRGAIAVALRGAHGSFGPPEVVDEHPSAAPAAAIGADGRGVVAWVRDRRVWAVSVDVEARRIGRPTAVTRAGSYQSVRVAAGTGGAATIAFRARRGRRATDPYAVTTLRRPAGGRFERTPRYVETLGRRGFLRDLAIAADDDGWTALTWSPEDFGGARDTGVNGVTSDVRVATARPGQATFGAVRVVAERGRTLCETPAIAAAAGRAFLAWSCRDRRTVSVFGATVGATRAAAVTTILGPQAQPSGFVAPGAVTAGLDAAGTATVVAVRADPPAAGGPPAPTTLRVLAVSGR